MKNFNPPPIVPAEYNVKMAIVTINTITTDSHDAMLYLFLVLKWPFKKSNNIITYNTTTIKLQ
jgi:hypothetical protein